MMETPFSNAASDSMHLYQKGLISYTKNILAVKKGKSKKSSQAAYR